jgi:6-phosphofructokinase 1
LLATKLGAYGIEMALTGKSSVMVGEQNNQLITHPIERSWEQHKPLDTYLAKIQQAFFDIDNKANPV